MKHVLFLLVFLCFSLSVQGQSETKILGIPFGQSMDAMARNLDANWDIKKAHEEMPIFKGKYKDDKCYIFLFDNNHDGWAAGATMTFEPKDNWEELIQQYDKLKDDLLFRYKDAPVESREEIMEPHYAKPVATASALESGELVHETKVTTSNGSIRIAVETYKSTYGRVKLYYSSDRGSH